MVALGVSLLTYLVGTFIIAGLLVPFFQDIPPGAYTFPFAEAFARALLVALVPAALSFWAVMRFVRPGLARPEDYSPAGG